MSNQNESDSNSDNERSEIPAAVNTQEPKLDELLDGQVQSAEQVQPVDEPPPLPPTRRSTRVPFGAKPLCHGFHHHQQDYLHQHQLYNRHGFPCGPSLSISPSTL